LQLQVCRCAGFVNRSWPRRLGVAMGTRRVSPRKVFSLKVARGGSISTSSQHSYPILYNFAQRCRPASSRSSHERSATRYTLLYSHPPRAPLLCLLGLSKSQAPCLFYELANRFTENAKTLYGIITGSAFEIRLSCSRSLEASQSIVMFGAFASSKFAWSCWTGTSWNGSRCR
jgi:hypothetical protein